MTKDVNDIKNEYATLESKCLILSDDLCGVKTVLLKTEDEFKKRQLDESEFPTGRAYYREPVENASATPGDVRLAHNEMLLRRLNTSRGIDHALEKLAGEFTERADYFNQLRQQLFAAVEELLKRQPCDSNDAITNLERTFNTKLICFLRAAGLDQAINHDAATLGDELFCLHEAYDKLLCFYRDMAAVIEPAAAMITVTRADKLTTTEIAKPITKKTEEQKESFERIKQGKADFQQRQLGSINTALQFFADDIKSDFSILPPQLRKSIAPGVKNGYDCRLNLEYTDGDEKVEESHEYLRCATLVYAGSGSTKADCAEYVSQNLKQLELYSNDKPIHISMLNTVAPYHKEHRLVNETQAAVKRSEKNHAMSYLPLNLDGTCRIPVIAKGIRDACKDLLSFVHTFRKATRALFAARVAHKSQQTHKSLSTCASGQDRTGTQTLCMKALWLRDFMKQKVSPNATSPYRLQMAFDHLARGQHNALLSSLAVPGSRGMKPQTRPGKLLGRAAKWFFLKTARHNKHTPVNVCAATMIGGAEPAFTYQRTNEGGQRFELNEMAIKRHIQQIEHYEQKAFSWGQGYRLWFNSTLTSQKKSAAKEFLKMFSGSNDKKVSLDELKTNLETLRDNINNHRSQATSSYGFFKSTPAKGRLDRAVEGALTAVNFANNSNSDAYACLHESVNTPLQRMKVA